MVKQLWLEPIPIHHCHPFNCWAFRESENSKTCFEFPIIAQWTFEMVAIIFIEDFSIFFVSHVYSFLYFWSSVNPSRILRFYWLDTLSITRKCFRSFHLSLLSIHFFLFSLYFVCLFSFLLFSSIKSMRHIDSVYWFSSLETRTAWDLNYGCMDRNVCFLNCWLWHSFPEVSVFITDLVSWVELNLPQKTCWSNITSKCDIIWK